MKFVFCQCCIVIFILYTQHVLVVLEKKRILFFFILDVLSVRLLIILICIFFIQFINSYLYTRYILLLSFNDTKTIVKTFLMRLMNISWLLDYSIKNKFVKYCASFIEGKSYFLNDSHSDVFWRPWWKRVRLNYYTLCTLRVVADDKGLRWV